MCHYYLVQLLQLILGKIKKLVKSWIQFHLIGLFLHKQLFLNNFGKAEVNFHLAANFIK